MPDQVIKNPFLNSAFREPSRHFKFTEEGLSSEIVAGRRVSSYFIPIAQTRKTKGSKQLILQSEWTEARIDEPYEKLKRALKADVDEAAWAALYRTVSRTFPPPTTGKIAVTVVNHCGNDVLKVFAA